MFSVVSEAREFGSVRIGSSSGGVQDNGLLLSIRSPLWRSLERSRINASGYSKIRSLSNNISINDECNSPLEGPPRVGGVLDTRMN